MNFLSRFHSGGDIPPASVPSAGQGTGENRQERSMGADLLRIVSMLMILTSHYFVHGNVLGRLGPWMVNFHICWIIESLCYVMVKASC